MQIGTSSGWGGVSLQLSVLNTQLTCLFITFFFLMHSFLSVTIPSGLSQNWEVHLAQWVCWPECSATYIHQHTFKLVSASSEHSPPCPVRWGKGFEFDLKTSLVYNYLNQYLWGTSTVVGTGDIIKRQRKKIQKFYNIIIYTFIFNWECLQSNTSQNLCTTSKKTNRKELNNKCIINK